MEIIFDFACFVVNLARFEVQMQSNLITKADSNFSIRVFVYLKDPVSIQLTYIGQILCATEDEWYVQS